MSDDKDTSVIEFSKRKKKPATLTMPEILTSDRKSISSTEALRKSCSNCEHYETKGHLIRCAHYPAGNFHEVTIKLCTPGVKALWYPKQEKPKPKRKILDILFSNTPDALLVLIQLVGVFCMVSFIIYMLVNAFLPLFVD